MQKTQGSQTTGRHLASASASHQTTTTASSTTTTSGTGRRPPTPASRLARVAHPPHLLPASTSSASSSPSLTPAQSLLLAGYQATQRNAHLTPPHNGDGPARPINSRQALKRPHESPRGSGSPADGNADKKAKAAGGGGNGIKQEHESEAPLPTESTSQVPEPMADGVDALLTLVLHTNPSPPQPPGPLSSSRPSSPPVLEPDPRARPTESKSSSESAAAPPRLTWRALLKGARDAPSLAGLGLSGPARKKEEQARRAVFDAFAQDLKAQERAQAFSEAGEHLSLTCQGTSEQHKTATILHLLEAQALVKHMTAQQRQEALRAAKRPVDSPTAVEHGELMRRRGQFISLYETMDPAARANELAQARREADLLDMDEDRFVQTVQIRAEQFAAHACLSTPEQLRAERARLREPGHLVHMEGEALRRALRLQAAQFWATLAYHSADGLQGERAAALDMPQALQEMGDAAWQLTLKLREVELEQHRNLMDPSAYLPALREALVPTPLAALRGPALERAVALRKLLVQQLFTGLPPADRDRALAEARTPETLADFSGQTLDTAIRLRKLVFEEYFRTVPHTDGAAMTVRVELASALDTTGLASQPEASMARAALLRLALVDVARQHAAAGPTSQAYGGVIYNVDTVARPSVLLHALPSSSASPPSRHTTTSSTGASAFLGHTGPILHNYNYHAPSSSSGRYVMNTGSLLKK